MKKIVFILMLVSIFAAGKALALDYYWSGADPDDDLISNPDNYWGSEPAPGQDDLVFIGRPGFYAVCDETVTDFEVKEFTIAKENNGLCQLDMSGGSISVTDMFFIAKQNNNGVEGVLNMSGGTISTGSWFNIGTMKKGTVNMTGGLIDVGTKLAMGMYGDGSAVLNLDGGTVSAEQIDIIGQSATEPTKINISYGTLKLKGDQVSDVLSFVSAGKIVSTTSYDVTASYDSNLDQTLVTAPEPATLAFLSAGLFAFRKKRRA
ncbi:hypothetical protein L21SP3_00067 [Sedimentisphaera cyanobacteriorum]|uniref:PEP-CTERM protein-sorting domain-containing protein n=1 Tax=Sedimentisphaera cyanobacteriorum TaxID=1940790 RepID=A0A1Q2HLZ4_9BACT|nr:PEP-CTERM sorting domain-containing protein [Sedimentisphaera cyanobacteriorum]AQQ08291.1 hypothetical protein L21SP3_00067 [Sedimentisphaera cyanobacteriorum]